VCKLIDFQSDEDIDALVAFSAKNWKKEGPWSADCFRLDGRFPLKLELSSLIVDTNRAVRGVFIVSKQKEKYYPQAEFDYLYIHKVVIDSGLRGGSCDSGEIVEGVQPGERITIDGRSLFGSLWDAAVNDALDNYALSRQILSVEPDNLQAIRIYNKYGFEVLETRSCGKLLMGRGW